MVDYTTSENPSSIVGGVEDLRDSIVYFELNLELSEDLFPDNLATLKKARDAVKSGKRIVMYNSDRLDVAPLFCKFTTSNTAILGTMYASDDVTLHAIAEFDLNTGKNLRYGNEYGVGLQ